MNTASVTATLGADARVHSLSINTFLVGVIGAWEQTHFITGQCSPTSVVFKNSQGHRVVVDNLPTLDTGCYDGLYIGGMPDGLEFLVFPDSGVPVPARFVKSSVIAMVEEDGLDV